MSTATFDRTLDQRRRALRKANKIRGHRKTFKAQAKLDATRALDVLARPPAWAETMKVFDLVLAMPTIGRVRARKLFAHTNVSLAKTVGGLSDRQRTDLLERIKTRTF